MDHDKLNELERKVQELIGRVLHLESQNDQLRAELYGLRDTLENMRQRAHG